MEEITLGTIKTFIINFASIITAGGIIGAFALKIGKRILDDQLQPFNTKMNEMEKARIEQHEETKREIEIIKKELNKNSLNTMKNTICNDNIPISERLIIGKEYIDKGGNGAVKVYLHKLEEDFEKKLQEENKF